MNLHRISFVCIELLYSAHCGAIIPAPNSKRLQNILRMNLDIRIRSPYDLCAPMTRLSPLGGLSPHRPRSSLSQIGALYCFLTVSQPKLRLCDLVIQPLTLSSRHQW